MASLRLTFPDKDQPTVIALTGARITIGRLPLNTIQIIDRTVSGFHAELISEHGHYRLHDRGSSNGTFVNGQKIGDYHLNEACSITLGSVEAQFSPEAVAEGEEAESFPSRSEVNAVRKENAELRATVEALREEVTALKKGSPQVEGDAKLVVPKEDYDQLAVEREALKEARLRQEEEFTRLKTDLAVLRRDRSNLQLAYDGVQAELEEVRRKIGNPDGVALTPVAAATALAAEASAESESTPVEEPVAAEEPAAEVQLEPTVEKTETKAPEPPVAKPVPVVPFAPKPPAALPVAAPQRPGPPSLPTKPTAPTAMPKPGALPLKPAASLAKPTAPPSQPTAPVVSPAAVPVPVAAKAPPGLGSGIRPMARPPIAPAGASAPAAATSESLPNVSTTRLAPRPLPTSKLPSQPTVKLAAVPLPPKVGPKGTQKLTGDAKPGAPKP